MCPYLPFSARVCLNQHYWLAARMREENVDFQQCTNAFLKCANPDRLQELADSLTARDVLNCGRKWLAAFTPFFTERERQEAGCQHRLFFAQTERCDNLIFRRRAALDEMGERLLDANRTIGQPNKITVIFGRKITKHYRGKLQTVIEDTLREFEHTAPYMHDGSLKTLEEVVDYCNKGGNPNRNLDGNIRKLNLTDQDKKDLVAFFESAQRRRLAARPPAGRVSEVAKVGSGDGTSVPDLVACLLNQGA
jgi:hypothetical protein